MIEKICKNCEFFVERKTQNGNACKLKPAVSVIYDKLYNNSYGFSTGTHVGETYSCSYWTEIGTKLKITYENLI